MWSRSAAAAFIIAAACGAASASPESDAYRALREAVSSRPRTEAAADARVFIRKFPSSSHIAEAKLVIADAETDPGKALSRYERIVENYHYFDRKEEARLSLCRLLFLSSRFAECAEEAQKGCGPAADKAYRDEFILLKAKALCAAQKYDEAAADLSGADSPEAQIVLAEARSRNGDDGVWQGLSRSAYPETALFCLAKDYESGNMKDEAFSAYSDLIRKYPRSAEALSALKSKTKLAKAGARYKTVSSAKKRRVDTLKPDREITERGEADQYAVLIGPFFNLKEAGRIKKEMTAEFDHAVIVKKEREFAIYVGRAASQDDAVSLKIRLAEEFGFNGAIVNIREEDNREYIYGQ